MPWAMLSIYLKSNATKKNVIIVAKVSQGKTILVENKQ
jgi:hypothetical protein